MKTMLRNLHEASAIETRIQEPGIESINLQMLQGTKWIRGHESISAAEGR